MSLNPDIAEQQRIATAAERRRGRMDRREKLVEGVFGTGLVVTALALIVVTGASASRIHLAGALVCMACLALAANVPFAVGGGYTVPTQLVFVPLLFTMPPAFAPLAVAMGLTVARVPAVVAGRRAVSRLWAVPGDAWFAVGPALVLVLAGAPSPHEIGASLVVAMLAAQILVEIAFWAAREHLLDGVALESLLEDLWVHAVDVALTPVGLVVAADAGHRPWKVVALAPLLGVLAIFSREREARLAGMTELNQAYRGTALVLGDVVEADDGYTGEHSKGVVALAMEVGEALGLDAAQQRNLEFGALLHDVGKVAIPKEIINKPGKLDPSEWAIIKTHTFEGQRMLDRVGGFMREVGLIVRSHHERWDGAGYPDGLAGEQIPLESRIVSCCDTWNAMTTTRSYRPAMSPEEAVAEMRRCAGTQLDPRVVQVVLQIVAPEHARTPETPELPFAA
jgi:putative nucleotidyltransferase with HDIG domain